MRTDALGVDGSQRAPKRVQCVGFPHAIPTELTHWTAEELDRELRRFEAELRRAGLKESSVATYVDRSSLFIRWLRGDYEPRGPNR